MAQPTYDPSSKWMLEEQGRSILYLGGARRVLSCRARKAEVVQPRKLPGGTKAMIESPLIQEIVEESDRAGQVKAILRVLETRWGAVTPAITAGLEQVKAEEKLDRLTRQAVICPSLQAFEVALHQELPAPPPASTRGKRRSRKPPAL